MADRRAQIEAYLAEATPRSWEWRMPGDDGRPLSDLRWLLDALAEAEAERDALAATVRRVEALADEWEKNLALWGKEPSPEALVMRRALATACRKAGEDA